MFKSKELFSWMAIVPALIASSGCQVGKISPQPVVITENSYERDTAQAEQISLLQASGLQTETESAPSNAASDDSEADGSVDSNAYLLEDNASLATASWKKLGNPEPPQEQAPPQNQSQQFRDLSDAARKLELEGSFDEAIESFSWLKDNGHETSFVLHRLAILFEKTGKPELAQPLYSQAMDANPDDPELLCDVGYRYYLDGDLQSAAQYLTRALQLSEDLPRAHNNLAIVYAQTGQLRKSVDHFCLGGCSRTEAEQNLSNLLETQYANTGLAEPSDPKPTLKSRISKLFNGPTG